MENNKPEYCKADHHTLQEAKDKLHSLLTYIMMSDVGYILDKSLNESKEKMAILSKAKSTLQKNEVCKCQESN